MELFFNIVYALWLLDVGFLITVKMSVQSPSQEKDEHTHVHCTQQITVLCWGHFDRSCFTSLDQNTIIGGNEMWNLSSYYSIFFYPWSCEVERMLDGYLRIKARDGCLLFYAPLEVWFHSNSPDHLLRWLIHLQGSDIDEPASHCVRLNNTALHQSTFSLLNTKRPDVVSSDSRNILINLGRLISVTHTVNIPHFFISYLKVCKSAQNHLS